MESQNIYDNEAFFREYSNLRARDDNHNVLIEQPAMAKLLPSLDGKKVLDLGCGMGENCMDFARRGAERVLGIDISKRMLAVARERTADPRVEYRCMSMEDLAEIDESFDLIYSSLAFHYIEDLDSLLGEIRRHLRPGGMLLFSQEHPLNTAQGHFERDEQGNCTAYTVYDYNRASKIVTTWFVDGVEKYHRPMGQILTSLAHTGFIMEDVIEPVAEDWALVKRPALIKEQIKPCFLIVRAKI
ncbi:MAG: class I SAM-dependent methyltransferase [Clostridia bacterium]|nr:class I SAM-dependent methyltransferase [Clostridia bacterium]